MSRYQILVPAGAPPWARQMQAQFNGTLARIENDTRRLETEDQISDTRRLETEAQINELLLTVGTPPSVQDAARLDRWRAFAMGRLLSETVRGTIAVIGDSWTYNYFWIQRFTNRVKALYGDGGVGFVSLSWPTPNSGPDFPHAQNTVITATKSGTGWVNTALTQPTLICGVVTSSTVGDKFTVACANAVPVLSGAVLYYIGTGGGARYRWNGGAWTSITLSGTTSATASVTTNMPVSGTWAFEIEVVAGSVSLVGVDFKSSASGAVVHKCAIGGASATGWATQATTGGWGTHWTALNPETVIIFHGTNDQQTDKSVSVFKASLETLIDEIRAAINDPDILIAIPPENKLGEAILMSSYASIARRVSYERNVAFLNMQPYFGTDPEVYGAGWGDNVHPTDALGGRILTAAFFDAFRV